MTVATRITATTVDQLTQATRWAASLRRTSTIGNTANAYWAAAALAKYGGVVEGQWQNPLDTVFSDLLADLLHLADALDFDFDDLLRTAERRYTEEVDA